MEKDLAKRWQEEWQKSPKRNLCVCYDVPKEEVMKAIEAGADTFEKVSAKTYACQGAGCCERLIYRLLEFHQAHQKEQASSDADEQTLPVDKA
ncbi:(2Fe-2S)-binding protein [uncultured Thiomicrorhabdus sp.]